MTKPFKGIICSWWKESNMVYGRVMHHLNHSPATGHFAPGHRCPCRDWAKSRTNWYIDFCLDMCNDKEVYNG